MARAVQLPPTAIRWHPCSATGPLWLQPLHLWLLFNTQLTMFMLNNTAQGCVPMVSKARVLVLSTCDEMWSCRSHDASSDEEGSQDGRLLDATFPRGEPAGQTASGTPEPDGMDAVVRDFAARSVCSEIYNLALFTLDML